MTDEKISKISAENNMTADGILRILSGKSSTDILLILSSIYINFLSMLRDQPGYNKYMAKLMHQDFKSLIDYNFEKFIEDFDKKSNIKHSIIND